MSRNKVEIGSKFKISVPEFRFDTQDVGRGYNLWETITSSFADLADNIGARRFGIGEQQKLVFNLVPSSGAFTLYINNTETISLQFNASNTDIQNALITILGSGNIAVTGNFTSGFNFYFKGTLLGRDVYTLELHNNTLQNGATVCTPTITVEKKANSDGITIEANETVVLNHQLNISALSYILLDNNGLIISKSTVALWFNITYPDTNNISIENISGAVKQIYAILAYPLPTENTNLVENLGSSTNNALARFDLTTGKVIKNSGLICDNSNNITGVGSLNCTKLVADNSSNQSIEMTVAPSSANSTNLTDFAFLGGSVGLSRNSDGLRTTTTIYQYDTASHALTNIAVSSRDDIVFLPQGGASGDYETVRFKWNCSIFKQQTRNPDGTVTTPSYSFNSSTNTGMYYESSSLKFSVAGNSKLILSSNSAYILSTNYRLYFLESSEGGNNRVQISGQTADGSASKNISLGASSSANNVQAGFCNGNASTGTRIQTFFDYYSSNCNDNLRYSHNIRTNHSSSENNDNSLSVYLWQVGDTAGGYGSLETLKIGVNNIQYKGYSILYNYFIHYSTEQTTAISSYTLNGSFSRYNNYKVRITRSADNCTQIGNFMKLPNSSAVLTNVLVSIEIFSDHINVVFTDLSGNSISVKNIYIDIISNNF